MPNMTRRLPHTLATLPALLAASTLFAQACPDCDGNGVSEFDEQSVPNGLVGQYFRSQSGGEFTERLLSRIDPRQHRQRISELYDMAMGQEPTNGARCSRWSVRFVAPRI